MGLRSRYRLNTVGELCTDSVKTLRREGKTRWVTYGTTVSLSLYIKGSKLKVTIKRPYKVKRLTLGFSTVP